MGFSRQELWSGLPFPPPGNLPNPGIKPASPCIANFYGLQIKKIPPGRVALSDWLGHSRVTSGLGILASFVNLLVMIEELLAEVTETQFLR